MVFARAALQSFRSRCSTLGVSASGRPLGIGRSFRVPDPMKYRPYGLGDSTLPLAFSSALWLSLARFRLGTVQYPDRALSSSSASL
jgi:hypothetical protein